MAVERMDHVGVIVEDLEGARAFFEEIGLRAVGEARVDEPWAGRVTGLPGQRVELVMLETPDGHARLEVSRFLEPVDEDGPQPARSNRLGIRHLAFVVTDLRGMLERLARLGFETVGTVEDYRGIYLLCYVRGPEEIIVELAEEIGDPSGMLDPTT
ncbi:VOC family protein [Agrococcus jenensis]|uniref:Catechol 2,3-dioxygenase-like lactoylglutathione lyase family enzyme n=1 Tax=Agrococcus jenensis TaxID=46353 RepID=A0A3N2AWD4_9MICO|nr:VOC family protein [Agrococcus jenensis]ROR67248.1 catechol 2,3-dioxygenase-like lactoylglutathione lyase family enzyme [Agrococcus jenensis]